MFVEKGDDEVSILTRRSIFGYFCRRCFVSFIKLSFYGVVQLQKDYQTWCAGSQAGYGPIEKDTMTNDIWIFKTAFDFKSWARPEPFSAWEKGLATGDGIEGPENLRRYFEQHFHDHNDSGVRQHALLNLVRMHYVRNEQVAAQAIAVARTSGDRITLQHCISMLHRLSSQSQTPVLNEIQPDLHPSEVLYDVAKLLDPASGQPLTMCFEKLIQAIGLHNHWVDTRQTHHSAPEAWSRHAMQAVLWTTTGCLDIAGVEENILLSLAEVGNDDPNRLNTLLNRAWKRARRGDYNEALSMVMHPDAWRGMSMDSYALWAYQVWHILVLRATRRGQSRLFQDYLLPRRPSAVYLPKEYLFDDSPTMLSHIHMELYEVMEARHRGQAVATIQPLLQALWLSEFQCRFPLYRLGIILLADVGLEFGMTLHCRRLLEGILPQVMNGDELEHRALACFTYARCVIASMEPKESGLREALPYLLRSEADYASLQILGSLMDVQYLLSIVYHNLGMEKEQADAAGRHFETKAARQTMEEVTLDPEVSRIWEIVTESFSCCPLIPFSEWAMDGPPPQEEDFSSLPISERLAHKNWKARVSAYESLIKTFQTTASDADPAFKPYINNPDLLKKIATDSNAVAQEKGIECLVALVKFAGETAAKTRETVVPALVDKCFGSARAGTKSQAIELALQYIEVENSGVGVVADIIPGLSAKQPKAVAGTVLALKEIVKNFGTHVISPAPVLKTLPKIFAHTDKTVRAEGAQLTHILYQYIGPAIDPWLAELKPVQIKELQEAFEGLEKDGKGKGTLKADRMTREHAREAEVNQDAGVVPEDTEAEDLALPDPRTLAEPIDILPKLPSNFQTNLASSKWKERKEALDDLLTVVNATPRIKDASELGELAKSLATCIQKDANINCVMVAAGCIEGLAKGMMGSFARMREMVVPLMLERLKERKANVTDAIGAALDAVFSTTTLPDIIPDMLPALSNKNPQVKEGTLKFLGRSLSTSPIAVQPGQIKSLTDPLAILLEDGFEGARNEAATCLGTLMKMVGERPLNALMDGLADVRKAKVKEAYEKATVKAKAGAGGPPKPPPAASKEAPTKKPPAAKAPPNDAPISKADPPGDLKIEDEPPKKSTAKPPARLMAKKPPAAAGAAAGPATGGGPPAAAVKKPIPAAAAAKPAKGGAPAPPGALDTFKYKHTPEDAEGLAAELIPGTIMTGLGDSNWKARLAACEEMTTWIENVVDDIEAEVVVRALAKKGWAEKNFQVSAKLYGILNFLAERCPSFGRSCVALSTGHLSEKLGDMKLKKPAGDALLAFSEKTSLQFVLNQAYEPLGKQKAPKVLADALVWVDSAILEFGIAGLSLRNLIDFLKNALKNSNAAVRTSATKTLVTVKLFAGSSIKDLLDDLNPQLLVTIQSEFDKVEGNPAPEPSRTSADVAAMAPVAGAGSSKGGLVDPLDDLYPRVEIDGLLKGTTILADAKSDAWKAKKEALETLQAILDQGANKRLKPAMGEIGQVLKSRVVDTNKAVQTLALDIVARIATGMGKPFEKQTKFFVVPVATALSDQKAPIRTAALHTLSAIASACEGIDSMVHFLTTALESTNPTQRATLLGWIADHFKDHPPSATLDLSGWSGMIVSCLDDRSADVRKGAQAVLPTLITCVGFDRVMQQTNSLKPASRKTAVPLIQAARESAAPAAVEPPKAAPVASTVADNPPSPSPPPAATPSHPGPASKLTGVRRKLPQGTGSRPDSRTESLDEAPVSRLPSKPGTAGLKRPAVGGPSIRAPTSAALPVPAAATALPLSSMNLEAKRARLSKDAQRWVNEAGPTRKDLAEILQHQMEPHASKDVIALLFSHDHNAVNDHVSGLSTIYDFFSAAESGDDKFGVSPDDLRAVGLASFDLPLKYVSIKAHEPQSNLISRCLDVVEAVVAFLRSVDAHLEDSEAMCFVPTLVYKLGDAREPVRARVQHIIQSLPKVYAFSRVFDILLEYGLKSKVAKTRQGTLDELASLLKRNGMSACNQPSKAFPVVASMIADKDSQVRKSALSVLSEGYSLVGEKVWSLVGPLSPKDKTQLEERLRRVAGPSTPGNTHSPAPTPTPAPAPPAQVSRLAMPSARPGSPATLSKVGGGYRPASPAISVASRIARPTSPARTMRSSSPAPSNVVRPPSPARPSKLPGPSGVSAPSSIAAPSSPSGIGRPKTLLPSRLGPPRTHAKHTGISATSNTQPEADPEVPRTSIRANSHSAADSPAIPSTDSMDDVETLVDAAPPYHNSDDITVTISSILSSDPLRSVDALKKIQKILVTKPEDGHLSPEYRELAEHTEGLIETITLQMAHVFDRPDDLIADENFRLAKHLIQTLNTFCDHALLAESLTVDILTPLLEELTMRLLETDESHVTKVKDLSRFINMIILRLFATGRRMSIFRALFALLLQIVKPFPSNGTLPESKEARVAELVLKCVWKLARNIPQDLKEEKLDPVELLPAVEHFLQSVPPNEWRARATNKVPCGDMPLRTIKVIIQHVVAHYGDEVYDFLSASFDDPSATIVYPYVYRILNSSARAAEAAVRSTHSPPDPIGRPYSAASSRPISPQSSMASGNHRQSSPSHRTSPSVSSHNGNGFAPPVEEPDPEAQLLTIINHISSETTGAMHKEGITELHQFLKNYPHKRPRVEKLLESTGPAFRKYINRALASRAAEDMERTVAVASTLSKLESNGHDSVPSSPVARSEMSPRSPQHHGTEPPADDRLHKLHDLFQYKRASITSNGSSQGVGRSRVSES
ncbi:ARM repeat-containing protein [Leucogyrophana mollusca]|uniref:ARM repeat-containing protein n=1 Tax=Leucogyrophana mollusca TaxID=85980 RepID=A0ACB8C1J2_9AGAM|nr:ARM repeat-containing protein [Leucogyrophana mollusca]